MAKSGQLRKYRRRQRKVWSSITRWYSNKILESTKSMISLFPRALGIVKDGSIVKFNTMNPPNDNLDVVEDTALGGEGSVDNDIEGEEDEV